MRAQIIYIAMLVLTIVNPLRAQEKIESSESSFFVQTAEGKIAICGFEFTFMYRDRTYQAGALAGVTGSLSWTEAKGNIGLMLKIIGADFPNASKLDMTPTPFSVVHGFVTVDGKAVAPHGSFPCEQPTGFCGVYQIPNSVLIGTALVSGDLAIAFNQQTNGLDISLPVDTSERKRTKPDEFQTFTRTYLKIPDCCRSAINEE